MTKWKCEICENEFENFHAQGFDNKIYCPLCFFKKENQELKKQLHELGGVDEYNKYLLNQQKEFIKFLEDSWKETQDIWYIKILQKYKEIIGDDK